MEGYKIEKSEMLGEILNSLEEDHITEKYMMIYGGKNFEYVRGGIYTKIDLPEDQKNVL